MIILVTGGTGFVGRALVAALESRGDRALVVSRKPSAGHVAWDTVEQEVDKVDAVVHLAGEPIAEGRWTDERWRRITSSRVQSTERIAEALVKSARKPAVLVSASAVGIYGMRNDDRVLDESSPPAADALARLAVDWERAADPARRAGIRVVHPRLGVVLGRDGGAFAKMTAPFRFFLGGPLGNGKQWMSWIHLRDTVRAILFALDHDTMTGPVNVVSPNPISMNELAAAIGSALHRPSALRVPPMALKVAFGRGLAEVLLTGQRALPRQLAHSGFSFDFPTISAACADLLRSGA
jgi:uncharacterized protein (TIGR01777 family)